MYVGDVSDVSDVRVLTLLAFIRRDLSEWFVGCHDTILKTLVRLESIFSFGKQEALRKKNKVLC